MAVEELPTPFNSRTWVYFFERALPQRMYPYKGFCDRFLHFDGNDDGTHRKSHNRRLHSRSDRVEVHIVQWDFVGTSPKTTAEVLCVDR